jgi:hypothetical protein
VCEGGSGVLDDVKNGTVQNPKPIKMSCIGLDTTISMTE